MRARPDAETDLVAFTAQSGSANPERIEEILIEHPVKTTDSAKKPC
jgi:hypothetical protein